MRRASLLVAAVAALGLALAPGVADARAGNGGSWGSRGSRTWSAPPATNVAPYSAQPMQRSLTPSAPMPGPGYAAPAFGRPRSPFMSGLLGGLIGAGVGGLLFGHGLFGGISGIGSFFGFLLQIFLIVLVVRWLYRRFFSASGGSQPLFAGASNFFARTNPTTGPVPAGGLGGGRSAASSAQQVSIGPADYQAFEQVLKDVQAAWSANDLARIQTLATPEMVSYFAEQLTDYASRGLRNLVTDVRLLQGDLAESWRENGRDYATVAMRFSMHDVTRDAAGRLVDGSETEAVTATELWTFVRAPGGRWLLSAIQQAK
ncbi:MAG: Tim44 domain-containing protein [Acetobacteraceae bacterium]|nr:Tim44 domain-containing protein [Acetobacteraceae bacterium]